MYGFCFISKKLCSIRWFLSYTNCDACGRLFVKGKYCPVCLKVVRKRKSAFFFLLLYLGEVSFCDEEILLIIFLTFQVYRDSEMTPMVCCDICQQWVHCVCDGIRCAQFP